MIHARGYHSRFFLVSLLLATVFGLSCSRAPDQAEEGDPRPAIRDLIKRLLPHHADPIELEGIPKENGKDVFETGSGPLSATPVVADR
jgi:hypothetical protein